MAIHEEASYAGAAVELPHTEAASDALADAPAVRRPDRRAAGPRHRRARRAPRGRRGLVEPRARSPRYRRPGARLARRAGIRSVARSERVPALCIRRTAAGPSAVGVVRHARTGTAGRRHPQALPRGRRAQRRGHPRRGRPRAGRVSRAQWFDHETRDRGRCGRDRRLAPGDIIAVPEIYGGSIVDLPRGVHQVIFNQGAYLTPRRRWWRTAALPRRLPATTPTSRRSSSSPRTGAEVMRYAFPGPAGPAHPPRDRSGLIHHPPARASAGGSRTCRAGARTRRRRCCSCSSCAACSRLGGRADRGRDGARGSPSCCASSRDLPQLLAARGLRPASCSRRWPAVASSSASTASAAASCSDRRSPRGSRTAMSSSLRRLSRLPSGCSRTIPRSRHRLQPAAFRCRALLAARSSATTSSSVRAIARA